MRRYLIPRACYSSSPTQKNPTREFVSRLGGFFGSLEVAWPQAGSYELDIYEGDEPVLILNPIPKIFAWLFGAPAYAQDPERFIETIRFTITAADLVAECCSSVLFLPGIMGSRLYDDVEKRWEPSGEADVQSLYLDTDGKSENTVIAIGVIETFDGPGPLNSDIYKSFLVDLATASAEGKIAEYRAYAYDWRLSIPDILVSGTLEQTLRDLTASSKTGKVAIVAHSNGGLVAKALLNALAEEAPDLVDRLVLVGVPQLGTPQAVGALLHGFDSSIPFNWLPLILSPYRARDFARNAPLMYHLLPHFDYHASAGVTIPDSLITFKPGASTNPYTTTYGSFIETIEELHRFLTGEEGRPPPHYLDLGSPALAKHNAYW